MSRQLHSEQDTYVLPSYYGGSDSDAVSDHSTTPTSPFPQVQEWQDTHEPSISPINSVNDTYLRDDVSISPLSETYPADDAGFPAFEGPVHAVPSRHPEATLPPRGVERYYPPTSFRMDDDDITEKPYYAPGSPIPQQDRQRLRRMSDDVRLRNAELRAKHTVPAESTAVVPELAHLRTEKSSARSSDKITSTVPEALPTAVVPELAHLRIEKQSGRSSNKIKPTVPEVLPQYPPFPPAQKKHRRRSSLQRFKQAAAAARKELIISAQKVGTGIKEGSHIVSNNLKEGSQKVNAGLKEGNKKMRHSIQAVKRQSMDRFRPTPAKPAPVAHGPLHGHPSAHPDPTQQPRANRRRVSSPPAAAIAAALPPPEQVYANKRTTANTTFFSDCRHVSPPSSLPLDVSPVYVEYEQNTLQFPPKNFQQHLRSQNDHVDVKPITISVVKGRCAKCDWEVNRQMEKEAIDQHLSLFHEGYHADIAYNESKYYTACANHDTEYQEILLEEITALKHHLIAATSKRNDVVRAIWEDFPARWGPALGGIITAEDVKAEEEKEQVRLEKLRKHEVYCKLGRKCIGEGCAESDMESQSSASSRGTTGFGYNRSGLHGAPVDRGVKQEGMMRLIWEKPRKE